MKALIIFLLLAAVVAMFGALRALSSGQAAPRMARALTLRVVLCFAVFALVLISNYLAQIGSR